MEQDPAPKPKFARRSIPLKRVHERPGFNCRFSMTNIEELAASIGHPQIGLLFPPLVIEAPDRPPLSPNQRQYYIIHGHRRVAAVRSLGWKRCSFLVATDMGLTEQYILNLAENSRENLTPAEIAERCCMIVDTLPAAKRAEMTDALGVKMGYSRSHIRNLMRLRRNLHPDLWKMMVHTGHRAPVGALIMIVARSPDDQIAYWARIHKAVMEEPGMKEAEPSTLQRPTWRTRAAKILEGVKSTGESPEFVRGVRWAIERLAGNMD